MTGKQKGERKLQSEHTLEENHTIYVYASPRPDWLITLHWLCFSCTTIDVIILLLCIIQTCLLKWKKIFQKGKHHSSVFWKVFQICRIIFQNNFNQSNEIEMHSCLYPIKQIEVIEETSKEFINKQLHSCLRHKFSCFFTSYEFSYQ